MKCLCRTPAIGKYNLYITRNLGFFLFHQIPTSFKLPMVTHHANFLSNIKIYRVTFSLVKFHHKLWSMR